MAIGSNGRTETGGDASRWRTVALWLLVAAGATFVLWTLREPLDKAHVALAFLLVVLAGSARAGRLVGLLLSITCFLTFNFFLLPPLYALHLEDPLDWGVLIAFLLTGGVAAELLHRQRLAARMAQRRAREMDRLAGLVAESLSVGRATEAVEALTRVIRSELDVESCEILGDAKPGAPDQSDEGIPSELGRMVSRVAREGRCVFRSHNGTVGAAEPSVSLSALLTERTDLRDVLVPLVVRDRMPGVLWLSDHDGVRLDPQRARFADALAYYAALAAERVHLEREAERVVALRESDRLKDALLASVSHDLRTPLTTIRAAAGELRMAGEEQGELIEREAEHLNTLVSDLLDLSRLRAGKLPLSLELNAAEDLVGAVLQRLRGVPGADDVVVRLPADDPILVGRFDFVHSLRALTNIVENALRHSPIPGSVEIRIDSDDDYLLFHVLDEGPGVPKDEAEHLFEPFFRAGSSTSGGGTGLGLAIARHVAEAQEGSVGYEDRSEGGSVFTLRLPVADLEDASTP